MMKSMKNLYLGKRPPESLENIPKHLRPHHEFCFYLHDQMVSLFAEYEAAGVHSWVSNGIVRAAAERGFEGDLDVLDVLKKARLTEASKHLLLAHLVLGLSSDLLHFLYEGLYCLEKRKFAVALSLLRKPFKENMLFLAWLIGDADDFLARFEKDNYSTLNGLQAPRRRELLQLAVEQLAAKDAFDGELIERMVFSKEMPDGLEPLWQRATHLITSQGMTLRTEDLNINFIFNDVYSDHLYEVVYDHLPYLMLFLVQLSLRAFSELAKTNVATTNYLVVTSMGAYECLLGSGPRPMSRFIIKSLKPVLNCLHCKTPLRLNRSRTLSLLLSERVECAACRLTNEFPLYWLMAQSNLQIVDDDLPNTFDKLIRQARVQMDSDDQNPPHR